MKEVRIGVIGCGGMGSSHMRYFAQVPRLKFTAAADLDPAAVGRAVKEHGVRGFATGKELLDSGLVDAVIIATPHYFHCPLAIAAFERGIHVMSEKPVSVTAKAAAEAIAAHKKHPKLIYAAMFQMRLVPSYQRVKQVLDSGELGAIRRINWIITDWYRSQAYYDSGTWRATWGGEGGGVLLNQCPHNLDMFYRLFGMPTKVQAFLAFGKYHRIEVEDDVTAYMEFANGATGVFIATTGEAPGTSRMEITGDRGKLITDGGPRIEVQRTDVSIAEHCKTTRESFPHVPVTRYTIELESNRDAGHRGITTNFVEAILDGAPLIAPASDGIHSVELANAMIMSGLTGKPVPIPTDREAYDRLIKKMARTSKFRKTAPVAAVADLEASFKK